MSKRANYFSIGLFVLIAFAIGVGVFIFFGTSQLNRNTAIVVATFRESTNGLREGAKVKAYGVEVGQVKKIRLHRVEETDEVVIPVLMEFDLNLVSNLLGFEGVDSDTISTCLEALERNAHATLQLDSFVTGLLYVEIVFGNSGTGFVLQSERFSEYRAMPTLPTELQMLFTSIQSIVADFGKTDLVGLVEETKVTVQEVRSMMEQVDLAELQGRIEGILEQSERLVSHPEIDTILSDLSEALATFNGLGESLNELAGPSLRQAGQTMKEVEKAAVAAGNWLDPSRPVSGELIDALEQVGSAARSLRILADFLERNPNALLTGKPEPRNDP